jgi:hypothetical protein
VTIFILCGEALIFALHGWLTGALAEEHHQMFGIGNNQFYSYEELKKAIKREIDLQLKSA